MVEMVSVHEANLYHGGNLWGIEPWTSGPHAHCPLANNVHLWRAHREQFWKSFFELETLDAKI